MSETKHKRSTAKCSACGHRRRLKDLSYSDEFIGQEGFYCDGDFDQVPTCFEVLQ